MTVLTSGGHLTPALAFIDYLQTSQKNVTIVFVGRTYTRESDKQPSREKQEMEARGIKFIPLVSAKLNSNSLLGFFNQGYKFIISIFQASSILSQEKPEVFMSFGSHVAVPIAIACWLRHIPVVTHEQTRTVGLSNKIIGSIAKKIAISFPESAEYFPSHKTVLTGNLIRKQLLKKATEKPSWYSSDSTLPLLYITGGSQGSEVINSTVSQALPRILKDWQVIHQCGAASQTRSYVKELEQRKKILAKTHKARFFIREWITEKELAWIYKHAAACISRAGANTTQELMYNTLPSILIPLPFSNFQEQQKNAEALAATGGSILIPQKNLTPDTLIDALEILRTKNQACRRKLSELTVTEHADQKIFTIITELLPATSEKKE